MRVLLVLAVIALFTGTHGSTVRPPMDWDGKWENPEPTPKIPDEDWDRHWDKEPVWPKKGWVMPEEHFGRTDGFDMNAMNMLRFNEMMEMYGCSYQQFVQCVKNTVEQKENMEDLGRKLMEGIDESSLRAMCGIVDDVEVCMRTSKITCKTQNIEHIIDEVMAFYRGMADYVCGEGFDKMLKHAPCMVKMTSTLSEEETMKMAMENQQCIMKEIGSRSSVFTDIVFAKGKRQRWHKICDLAEDVTECGTKPIKKSCGHKAAHFIEEVVERGVNAAAKKDGSHCHFGMPHWAWYAIGGGAGLLLVVMVTTICCCCQKRKKRNVAMDDKKAMIKNDMLQTQFKEKVPI